MEQRPDSAILLLRMKKEESRAVHQESTTEVIQEVEKIPEAAPEKTREAEVEKIPEVTQEVK